MLVVAPLSSTVKRSSGSRTFLGHLNAVQFSSLDIDLVRGGPGGRRIWIDTLLTQLEPVYAYILQQYNQVLKQRNAFIKQHTANADDLDDRIDTTLLTSQQQQITHHNQSDQIQLSQMPTQMAIWDAQLATTGTRVTRRRSRVLNRLIPLAQRWHQSISGDAEALTIAYQPNVALIADDPAIIQQSFLEKIQSRAIAEYHQRTSLVGPHRDDIDFVINQTPARQYGSQGQQRTLVLSLKLAELELIEAVIGEPPLLLLDDVLAELDLKRQNQLLETIQDRFQTIITTTHLGSFDAQWLKASQILTVDQGRLVASS